MADATRTVKVKYSTKFHIAKYFAFLRAPPARSSVEAPLAFLQGLRRSSALLREVRDHHPSIIDAIMNFAFAPYVDLSHIAPRLMYWSDDPDLATVVVPEDDEDLEEPFEEATSAIVGALSRLGSSALPTDLCFEIPGPHPLDLRVSNVVSASLLSPQSRVELKTFEGYFCISDVWSLESDRSEGSRIDLWCTAWPRTQPTRDVEGSESSAHFRARVVLCEVLWGFSFPPCAEVFPSSAAHEFDLVLTLNEDGAPVQAEVFDLEAAPIRASACAGLKDSQIPDTALLNPGSLLFRPVMGRGVLEEGDDDDDDD